MRPLLLDLFCGAGGAAMGYYRAGFDVVGVDIDPQPLYPFDVVQADALNPPLRLEAFDAVHASPPCQRFSTATQSTGNAQQWPDLVEPTRQLLESVGVPYVIENVEGAPVRRDVVLCGSMFDMPVRRHRVFELGRWFMLQPRCRHASQPKPIVDVTGHAGGRNQTLRPGHPVKYFDADHARASMGMPWADSRGCVEAIPPAYTEHLGRELINAV